MAIGYIPGVIPAHMDPFGDLLAFGGRKTILLAKEDSPEANVLHNILSGSGYAVVRATSYAGLRDMKLKPGTVDAAVVDVSLPTKEGAQGEKAGGVPTDSAVKASLHVLRKLNIPHVYTGNVFLDREALGRLQAPYVANPIAFPRILLEKIMEVTKPSKEKNR